jgi:hypothetical protein
MNDFDTNAIMTDEGRKILFGQTANSASRR